MRTKDRRRGLPTGDARSQRKNYEHIFQLLGPSGSDMITTYCLRSTFVQFLLFDSDDDVFNQPHHTTKSGYNNFIIYRIDLLDTHVLSFYYYYFLMFVFSFHKEIDLVRYAGPNNQTKGNIWEIDRLL